MPRSGFLSSLKRDPWRWECQAPVASFTHFLVKLVLAAPDNFLSAAWLSQTAAASDSHFFMKLVSAAPASFFRLLCRDTLDQQRLRL